MTKFSNVIGIDDSPFDKTHDRVMLVATVFAGRRLDAVLTTHITRDGDDATAAIAQMVEISRFNAHTQMVLLQGIAVGGFNVIDIQQLHASLQRPVMVVSRRDPDMQKIKAALFKHVSGGRRKWQLIEKAGAMEPVRHVYIQRAGINLEQACRVLDFFCYQSRIPEPLRCAHLIAGGVMMGSSGNRV